MYNRYLSQDDAPYVRATAGNSPPSPQQSSNSKSAQPQGFSTDNSKSCGNPSPVDRIQNLLGLGGGEGRKKDESMLRRLLARFHLEDVDTGDLMLLILLFFLLEEKADDELLIALGLLLIL